MAITFAQLQELIKGEQLNYYIAPDRPLARFGIGGTFGRYEINIHLQADGQFLQFRTTNYLCCPASHVHLGAVLQTMSGLNFRCRLVKWGWDDSDGEVVAYADHWLMDNQITHLQFRRMLSNYLPGIDSGFRRLKATIETGKDPGDLDPQTPSAGPAGGAPPPMPTKLKELLEKLEKKPADKPGDGAQPESKKVNAEAEIREI